MKNKVILITGGANGIGKGIAEKFASSGAQIVIADINLEQAKITAVEIAKKYDVKTLAVAIDIASPESIKQGMMKIQKTFNRIDCLVNNAGIQHISSVMDFELEAWRKVMSINLDGAFLISQACMRAMSMQTQGGSIIFIGSIHSIEASVNKSAYIAAKHGLLGLMRAIAKEGVEHQIRSYLIGPGFVKTQLVEKQLAEQATRLNMTEEEVQTKIMLAATLDKQFTTVEEVANAALFFAQDSSGAMTGQSLIVSHGYRLQ